MAHESRATVPNRSMPEGTLVNEDNNADAPMLPRLSPGQIGPSTTGVLDPITLEQARRIVEEVRAGGAAAVRDLAQRFGERGPSDPLVLGREEMDRAADSLDPEDRAALDRAASRIDRFARAQRASIRELDIEIPGGRAGHTLEPVASMGCYAPAGRYPLPSSVLMTAVTARAAGCQRVVVASPGAHPVALAAAGIAGADSLLAVGGAHAVAAMALGIEGLDRCDMVVGPGNRWVTAAKQIVSAWCGIDMLAGPSELLILADASADPGLVAADLLAQAEHDTDARAMLISTSPELIEGVDEELRRQLDSLDTREVARAALGNGFACLASDPDEAIGLCDRIGPEHLEIMMRDADEVARRVRHAGAVFIGPRSAEVLGDYGAGPNHTLPTGGTSRFAAGLSVMTMLRARTWLRIGDAGASADLLADTQRLAQMEGLSAHAASASRRHLA